MKTVISASRRTDMPAHYLDRLIACIRQGFAEVPNPYSGKPYRIGLDKDDVHTIVLWSKNFGPFLKGGHALNPYSLYFLFTINDMPDLEPGVPPLSERFDQLDELAARYGPERIGWRFDPVVFRNGLPVMGIDTFERLADRAAKAGVSRVITSFLDMYGKVKKRNEALNLGLNEPPDDVKRSLAGAVADCAATRGMTVEMCCENLPGIEGVKEGSCIDGALLARLAGEPADLRNDPGQRAGCGCTVSRDIGSYRDMPCHGGCLYCYANPVIEPPGRITA